MLPYVEQPVLEVGSARIEAFHVLVLAGALTGFWLAVRRAVAAGLEAADAVYVVGWMILWGFVGSHVFEMLVYQPGTVARDPLQLLRIWSGMSSYGGILGGLLAAVLLMRRRALGPASMARLLDAVAFAFPFAWLFGRAGCALAHDHLGLPSTHWLAVRFPTGPRFDLGLLELFYTVVVASAFAVLGRRRRPVGLFTALFLTLYGPMRFVLDGLRTGDARYFGWTPAQYLSLVAACVGVGLLIALVGQRRAGAGE